MKKKNNLKTKSLEMVEYAAARKKVERQKSELWSSLAKWDKRTGQWINGERKEEEEEEEEVRPKVNKLPNTKPLSMERRRRNGGGENKD